MEREKLVTTQMLFIMFTLAVVLQGCVSVNIGQKPGERSSGVSFEPPTSPFEPLNETRADGAWLNKQNGNSISFFSTCNDPSDPSLEFVEREMLSDLKDTKVIQSQSTTFNGREAIDSEIEGAAEGVSTRVRSVVFKKNGCLYSLNYIGLTKVFDENRAQFSKFLSGFQAP